jgi:hypothetical protein
VAHPSPGALRHPLPRGEGLDCRAGLATTAGGTALTRRFAPPSPEGRGADFVEM